MTLPRNPSPVKASRAVKRAARLVFLFSLCLYAATTGGSMATDIMTYEVTKAIVEQNSVALPYNVFGMEAHRGVDGRYYAPYGIGHALYSVPFYMLGRVADHFTEILFDAKTHLENLIRRLMMVTAIQTLRR